ncbi:hypothetical protein [Sphingomonas psychrotolerans]|nr:hypothetical protein [Sphingomonas psychrotolerans]
MAELERALASRHHAFVLHYIGATFASAERRVTAVAARNMGTGVTHCFEVEAELRGAAIDPMAASAEQLDKAERRLLDAFYAFARAHPNHFWLHWNMRNSVFGFLGLENRYRELGGYPAAIPDGYRLDLADRLADIHGDSYADTANRLRSLADINGIPLPHLVDGQPQGEALERREFGVGTRSLLNRIDVMYVVATRTLEGRLKTATTFRDRVATAGGWIKWAKGHPVAVGFAIAAPVITVVLGCIKLWVILG